MTTKVVTGSTPRKRRSLDRGRPFFILIHRWVGLVMAVFLLLAGVTGSLLAFYADLDAALNPELFVAQPGPGAKLLDPIELRERVKAQVPRAELEGVILQVEPGKTVNYWIDGRETFVDPYTGRIVGSRKFGDLGEGKKNLLTFVYVFHYSLALGEFGTLFFGVIALLWFVDCFVGAYLTFPLSRPLVAGKPRRLWLVRWAPAWLLKTTRLFSLVFTWHRASGLWIWGMLLVFAWSGVALNLGSYVYEPVMNLTGDRPPEVMPDVKPPRTTPKLDWQAARERGRELLREQAARGGFQVFDERWLFYEPEHGAYSYTVHSSLDVDTRLSDTRVHFDGDDGRLFFFYAPTSLTARGSIDSWLIALHFGAVRELGVFYRAFVSALGLMVALLSVTGVWIWWRKRTKRRANEP